MDAAFPPTMRLHDSRDYGRVFNRQQKAAGRNVVLLLRPRERHDLGSARLGVMVASKTVPSAVRRHQLKRWVRELFRLSLKESLRGFDAVVLFRNDPRDGHPALSQEILALVPKAIAAAPNRGGGPPRRQVGKPRPAGERS